jgi:hypothetical protein
MRRRTKIVIAVVAFSVLALGYVVRVVVVHTYHDDACLVIAMLVADKIEKGEVTSEAVLRREIADLIRASVIHGRVDSDGRPTDLNGNPFLIQHTTERATASTRISVFQPICSRAEVDIKPHNKADAPNAAIATPVSCYASASRRR